MLLGIGVWLVAPGVSRASTNVSALVCPDVFDAVTLTSAVVSPTTATAAAVEGTAEPNSSVSVSVNGVQRATVTTALDGTYGATVPLVIGDNTIVATASDGGCGNSGISPALVIDREQVPPGAPAIASPLSGTVTTASTILLHGSAEADAELNVMVDGVIAATLTVPGDGLFGVSVPLAMGVNQIQASATNPAGTGPLSAAVVVTRQPVPLQPAAPTATPTPSPRPSARSGVAPQIVTPATGTTTAESSIAVAVAGAPGAMASVRVGGAEAARMRLGSEGAGEVTVPLKVGENVITVVMSGRMSAGVTVWREAVPMTPVITEPTDGLKTRSESLTVAGRADPDSRVAILIGNNKTADVTADETGKFAARINLRTGINLIYAQVEGPSGKTVRSAAVQVDREEAGPVVMAKSGLAALIAVPAAAVLLTVQGLGEVLAEVAASPLAVALVLSFSAAVSTMGRGLLGLEIFLLLPGLMRSWLARRRDGTVRGRVLDSVTGRPLAMAKVTLGAFRPAQVVTGSDGWFSAPAPAGGEPLVVQVDRPGYQTEEERRSDLMVALEPRAATYSPMAVAMEVIAGVVAWPAMIFGVLLSVYIFVKAPGVFTLALALIAVVVLSANAGLLISQPNYRWGRVTDEEGEPVAEAEVSLVDAAGRVASVYRTDKSGRYTLFAEPGEYHLKVVVDGAMRHDEPLLVRKRGTYLGYRLKLPAA